MWRTEDGEAIHSVWDADDSCLSIWALAYATGVLSFPPQAQVLEIGCAEADWMTPMLSLRPDLQLTGIDWRGGLTRPGQLIQGDVLTVDWPQETFDAIVGISSIEHVGLGHYSDDPLDVDGDRHCLERATGWLKPGGWIYLDVPYDPSGFRVCGTACRIYDDRAIATRLLVPGLTLRHAWYGELSTRQLVSKPGAESGLKAIVALHATKGEPC